MDFQDLLAQNGSFGRQNRVRGGAMLTPNELFLLLVVVTCATFGENRSRNATVRVQTDRQTDTRRDRDKENL